MTTITYTTSQADFGMSIREILRSRRHCSSQFLKQVRLYGNCEVDGLFQRLNQKIDTVSLIEVFDGNPDREPLNHLADAPILYQNEHFVVLNKPPGIVTHPTRFHPRNTLTDLLSATPLHPITRLDRHTSGAIIIACNSYAHHALFACGIDKTYLALVHGRYQEFCGTITAPIRRSHFSYLTRVVQNTGKPSVTHYQEVGYDAKRNISLMAFRLETGRTHQIRVHTLYCGHPLLGDKIYGLNVCCNIFPGCGRIKYEASADAEKLYSVPQLEIDKTAIRQTLHAYIVAFTDPLTNERHRVTAPLPPEIANIVNASASLKIGLVQYNLKQAATPLPSSS